MRILLIAPAFYDYHRHIVAELDLQPRQEAARPLAPRGV